MKTAFRQGTKPAYHIVSASSVELLAQEVSDKIADGYRLVGGPFVYGQNVCQALFIPPET